jgi:hypothetical protein
VQGLCGAVQGCRAFATAGLRQGLPASGAQAPRVCPGPKITSAKRAGRPGGSYRGLVVAGVAARGGRQRGPVAERRQCSRTGCCGGTPGAWIPRAASGSCCETKGAVSEAEASTAAWNHGGGRVLLHWRPSEIPGEARPSLGVNEFGDALGASAKTLRGLVVVGVWWSGVTAAAQSLCAAEQGEAVS